MTDLLTTRGISKAFGGRPAVRGVDASFSEGERVLLVGPNGSGKTTLLRLLSTACAPDSGELMFRGRPVQDDPVPYRAAVGMVPHEPFVSDELTVLENLQFTGAAYGLGREEAARRANALIDEFDLRLRRHDGAGSLSQGMLQRLSICCAFVHRPDIVLLDEPYRGLDPKGVAAMDRLISTLDEGALLIMTTHDVSRDSRHATRVVALDEGRVAFDGPASGHAKGAK